MYLEFALFVIMVGIPAVACFLIYIINYLIFGAKMKKWYRNYKRRE